MEEREKRKEPRKSLFNKYLKYKRIVLIYEIEDNIALKTDFVIVKAIFCRQRMTWLC